MPIWLNYTHISYPSWKILLPNYIYLLQKKHDVRSHDEKSLRTLIERGELFRLLEDTSSDQYFDDPLIRKILLESYPYEVELKFLWSNIKNKGERNERLVNLFDELFQIDYKKVLWNYRHEHQSAALEFTKQAHDNRLYDDIAEAKKMYIDFTYKLLEDQWYIQEKEILQKFCDEKLLMKNEEGISWVTYREGKKIVVKVGNNTYTTLFHELTHAINSYFRFDHYEGEYICDHTTKTNEWLSNFVAYHAYDHILSWNIEEIETMNLDHLFFSMYIDIYKTISEIKWWNLAIYKQKIRKQLEQFEGDLLTDEKADFYYQRFYKFFHYDQNEYFYPKEMLYYLWYDSMRQLFIWSTHKNQLLADCLLWKICL